MSAKWTFWAWEQPIKSAPKKLALLQLANNANDDGKSWYSIGKMATACGVSERTFQRSIKDLECDNLLHVERRSNRPSIYHLKDDEIEIVLHNQGDTESPLSTNRGDTLTGQGDTLTGQGDRESHDLNNHPNNELNKSNKTSMSKKDFDVEFVIDHLNKICGTKYKSSTKSHAKEIRGRLSEGHSVEDIKKVIDRKFAEWGSNPDMAQYLRPQTLFSASKFQGYLTAANTKPANQTSLHNLQNIDYGQPRKI